MLKISATEIVSQHRRYADERGDSREGDVPGGRIYVSGEDSKNMIVTEKDGQWTPEEIVAAGRRNASRYRILIVDDSEMNRMILSEMLKGEFEILEAENVQHVSTC